MRKFVLVCLLLGACASQPTAPVQVPDPISQEDKLIQPLPLPLPPKQPGYTQDQTNQVVEFLATCSLVYDQAVVLTKSDPAMHSAATDRLTLFVQAMLGLYGETISTPSGKALAIKLMTAKNITFHNFYVTNHYDAEQRKENYTKLFDVCEIYYPKLRQHFEDASEQEQHPADPFQDKSFL